MQDSRRPCSALALCAFSLVLLTGRVFGEKAAKTYPEEGKVVGTGMAERGQEVKSHLYKVETGTRIFVLDCGTRFGFSGGECGGQRKIQIGDAVHFRVDKNWVYIPIITDDQHTGEQKLRIVSQELKQDGKP
jgi:hypothetical protein